MIAAHSTGAGSDAGKRSDGASPTLAERWHINKRTIQIVLGILWIIDAGLQFQPRMFGSDFVSMVIAPNASDQPSAIASSVSHMANFLSRDVALWNTVFGLSQLAIGIGLLRRRTVKVALAASIAWAAGVWWFGEGFGSIFTGHASALMGAPGAVLLYAVIGILIWPTAADAPVGGGTVSDRTEDPRRTGLASSAAGHGPLGGLGGLWVWAALWVFFAVLQFLPQNRTSGWLSDSLSGMADGQPGWYGHFLRSLGHAFTGAGTPAAVGLATLFLLIGLGPFVTRRPDIFIGIGMGVGALFWVTGQAMGGIFTGMATDPNAGPLLILLGAVFLPRVLDPVTAPVPLTVAFARHQIWATLGIVALAIVPAAIAVIPEAPAAAASGSTMKSMTMSGSSSSPTTTTPATSAMKAMPGMSGSSASGTANSMSMSGMAGLGVTDPNWKYTGPPLPAGETTLLTSVGSATDSGHQMQTPSCSTAPTDAQVLGAVQYVQATSEAVAKYKNLSAATAAGYRPITSAAYPIVHYINPSYMNKQDILDPNHVDSLVYAMTPTGPVLVAAMYLLPTDANGPMPYGCLVQWHAHTNLCTSSTTHQIVGFTPCAPGTVHDAARTPYMTHVWQVPVAGGPLAIDPSDLQVMQAAVMSQQA
ncbi:MAG TPA: hypothetical protein VHU85_04525 [Acidimicrobiales bacterium]|nr:hypothetical protein [Acidimicrobiales bacterium]